MQLSLSSCSRLLIYVAIDAPARPSFRATLSQPSQMGNFRHQSLRTTERERDADRERQRDERDREGQERLRNVRVFSDARTANAQMPMKLSDKYDRDRLALSSTTGNNIRTKDRESAPHLSSGSSTRVSQGQSGSVTRRADSRDAVKKKPGESSDDWRRGMLAVALFRSRTDTP